MQILDRLESADKPTLTKSLRFEQTIVNTAKINQVDCSKNEFQ